ncbi:MAG: S-layer protein domain-containing protein, partial [Euryarchaeota archaeon]|nr:S-layer protein domain-containing protein [Euryarchaeota archaeon]
MMNLKYPLIGLLVSMLVGCGCAAALPFSGETVQVTGNQTEDIAWNESNFGGFCYNLNDDGCIGTETLSIGAGALEGPDIDRFIDVDNLTYTTSPIWQEYELHKNLELTVESDNCGGDSGYWIEFWMGERYVAIDGKANKLAKPLVEFDDTDIKTLATGEEWDIGGGFTLNAMQLDCEGEKVWFCLCKNGKEIDNEVIGTGGSGLQGRVYTYTEDMAGVDDVPVFSCYVSAVFRGTCSNVVQIEYLFLIDNDVTRFHTGNEYGSMKVVTASSSGVILKNNATINLTPNTTAPIMGNLSFKATDNTSTIEFYPHLVRDELPVLSGGGGFVLDDCWIDQPWNLSEDYSIAAKDVSFKGNKARITLLKNGVVVDERILTEEQRAPVDSDCRYSYVQNGIEIINASLKAAFRGNDSNVVELAEVYQRSEVNGSILIHNESRLFESADPAGIPWGIADGYVLTVEDIGLDGDEVWLELSKNGTVVKETILNDDFANTSTFACNTSNNGSINCVVDTVFRGSKVGAVKLVNLSQYSDANGTVLLSHESHLYKTSDPEGIPWELVDGCVLTMKDVEEVNRNYWCYQYHARGDKVWLELSRDGSVLKEDILESGDLFKYSNGLESVDCIVEKVFNGGLADVVKLTNVNQYSDDGTRLIENGTKTYATLDPTDGDIWECWEGYSLALKDVDLGGEQVWISLSKNDMVVEDAIIDDGGWFKHHNSTGALVFSTCVDTVFRGVEACSVQLIHTMQYSETDGKLFIEPSTESWQLPEGYYLTAQDIYRNDSVWLQLSKNDKLVDEGLFYNNSSFLLQNDTACQTIVSGMVCSDYWDDEYVQLTSITQYHETNGTTLATRQSKTIYASRSFNDGKTLSVPLRFATTLTVDDSGGADFTSIKTAVSASIPGDTIYVHAGTYVEKVQVYKRLTLEGEGADVVTVTAESASGSVFRVDSDHANISGFTVTGATDYGGSGISISGVDYCNILGNNVSNNFYGICIKHSSDNTLTDNTISENTEVVSVFRY